MNRHGRQSLNQRVAAGVRAELARHNESQEKLAKHLGLGVNALRRRLTDETSFTVREVDVICGYFEVSPRELIREPLPLDIVRVVAAEMMARMDQQGHAEPSMPPNT